MAIPSLETPPFYKINGYEKRGIALGNLWAKEAVPQVVRLLQHERADVRKTATWTLRRLGARESVTCVAKLLKDDNKGVRAAALGALRSFKARECLPQISQMLAAEKEGSLKRRAISLLGNLNAREPQYITQIAEYLEAESAVTRSYAAEALGMLGATEFAPQIVELLDSHASSDREIASIALARLGADEFTAQIATLLNDEDNGVRIHAITALAQLDAKEFIPQFTKLLEDEDEKSTIQDAAIWALVEMEGNDQITMRLGHQNSHVRRVAARARTILNRRKRKDHFSLARSLITLSVRPTRRLIHLIDWKTRNFYRRSFWRDPAKSTFVPEGKWQRGFMEGGHCPPASDSRDLQRGLAANGTKQLVLPVVGGAHPTTAS